MNVFVTKAELLRQGHTISSHVPHRAANVESVPGSIVERCLTARTVCLWPDMDHRLDVALWMLVDSLHCRGNLIQWEACADQAIHGRAVRRDQIAGFDKVFHAIHQRADEF